MPRASPSHAPRSSTTQWSSPSPGREGKSLLPVCPGVVWRGAPKEPHGHGVNIRGPHPGRAPGRIQGRLPSCLGGQAVQESSLPCSDALGCENLLGPGRFGQPDRVPLPAMNCQSGVPGQQHPHPWELGRRAGGLAQTCSVRICRRPHSRVIGRSRRSSLRV